jgi:hypothetical protein
MASLACRLIRDPDRSHVGFRPGKAHPPSPRLWRTSRRVSPLSEQEASRLVGRERPTQDAAGNLTYDGLFKYTFDAWNRLAKVEKAYRDSNGTLQTAFTVGTIRYDALGRRVSKAISNSANWNGTYRYYYSGQSVVEERNSSDKTLRQYVWGTQYTDELVQIGINDDPGDTEQNCETFYYAMQDANYNVLGIVNSSGDLKERYEYTPYGQRTVYKSAGANDLTVMSPLMDSQQAVTNYPHGLCDFGMQGKLFDKEWGTYHPPSPRLPPSSRHIGTDSCSPFTCSIRWGKIGNKPPHPALSP